MLIVGKYNVNENRFSLYNFGVEILFELDWYIDHKAI